MINEEQPMKVTKKELEELGKRAWGDRYEPREGKNEVQWFCALADLRGFRVQGGGSTRMQARRNLKFAMEGMLAMSAKT